MPVTAIGKETATPTTTCGGASAANGSPYAVQDYKAIEPGIGTSQDLIGLVQAAHGLGMHVILDEVLNHTSWDNQLVTQHPEYFLHCDGNRNNPNSIQIGAPSNGNFPDVAQLDYKTMPDVGLRQYITDMLVSVIQTYDVDGFRFDTADDPYGTNRFIPLDFWTSLRSTLLTTKPGFFMLGEEEDPDLTGVVFDLDYGLHLNGVYAPPNGRGLQGVCKDGSPATVLQDGWNYEQMGYMPAARHMALLQDWDLGEDLNIYGGAAQTLAAATFNFTIDRVPMIFNGEEVGNDNSGDNTHTPIDWNSPNAGKFTQFYQSLLALRNGAPTLQTGTLTWISNSNPSQVATYTRSDSNGTYLIAINFSGGMVSGTVQAPNASGWTDVSPVGSPGGTSHTAPPNVSLQAFDFEVFRSQ